MGIDLTDPNRERVPSFTLGVAETSPLEMAEAYATFAGRGLHCDARPVTSIEDSDGNVLKDYPEQCTQVMPAADADAVNDILRGVQEPGGFGYDAGISLVASPRPARPAPSPNNMAVWFVGYTPNLATASMIAGANDEGTWVTLNGQNVGGTFISAAHGSTTAGPMWGDAMKAISAVAARRRLHPAQRAGHRRRAHRGARHGRHERRAGHLAPGVTRVRRRGRRLPRQWLRLRHGRLHAAGPRHRPGQRHHHHDLPVHRPGAAQAAARRRWRRMVAEAATEVATAAATGAATAVAAAAVTATTDQPSWRRTSAATAPPSARPLTWGVTTPMTRPIAFMPSSATPSVAMVSATRAEISSSVSCAGR